MTEVENKGNPLGTPLYGDALKKAVDEVSKFLEAICLPAAQELGLLLGDKVRLWRFKNTIAIVQEAKRMLEDRGGTVGLSAPPRVIIKVLEEGSCVQDTEVQKMWAGLLASSCTKDGKDDVNLIFLNILTRITTSQARIINLAFKEGVDRLHKHGQRHYTMIEEETSRLLQQAQLPNSGMLFCILEHLGSLGLLSYQIRSDPQHEFVRIRFEDSALQLYARCQGHSGSLDEFLASKSHQ